MSVILLEARDPRQPRESTGELVAVEHTKVSYPQGKLPPPPRSVVKNMRLWMRRGRGEGRNRKKEGMAHPHTPVPRAVHRLEGEGLLLNLKREHVLCIMLLVARRYPQLAVVDLGTPSSITMMTVFPCTTMHKT